MAEPLAFHHPTVVVLVISPMASKEEHIHRHLQAGEAISMLTLSGNGRAGLAEMHGANGKRFV